MACPEQCADALLLLLLLLLGCLAGHNHIWEGIQGQWPMQANAILCEHQGQHASA